MKTLQKLYINPEQFRYYSPRYRKWITVLEAYRSDGATGARDISGPYYGKSKAWLVHDVCVDEEYGKFDDGTPITNDQASWILHDILTDEGRYIRRWTWLFATMYGRPILNWIASRFKPNDPDPPNICYAGG